MACSPQLPSPTTLLRPLLPPLLLVLLLLLGLARCTWAAPADDEQAPGDSSWSPKLLSSLPGLRPKQQDLFSKNFLSTPWLWRKGGFNQTLSLLLNRNKLAGMLAFVHIEEFPCMSSTSNRNGTCQKYFDCVNNGGRPSGTCAKGFGTCCVAEKSCGDSSSMNLTYFASPPQYTGMGQCQLIVKKVSQSISQLRLDFLEFSLLPPDPTTHLCQGDLFIVSGASRISSICGSNRGQHIYVHTGPGETPTSISVVSTNTFNDRGWLILVTQISELSPYQAPVGCLQFFSSTSGMVRSFNFDGTPTSRIIAEQNYGICIRPQSNYCGIVYMECASPTVNDFSITGMQQVQAMNGADMKYPGINNGATATNCNMDFLLIPCASAMKGVQQTCTANRFCGGTLTLGAVNTMPGPIFSWLQPFVLRFKTDNTFPATDVDNRGFCIQFVQQPCT